MQHIQQQINRALTTPMNRREFLKQVGLILLSLVGVTQMLRAMGNGDHRSSNDHASGGYGHPPYGI